MRKTFHLILYIWGEKTKDESKSPPHRLRTGVGADPVPTRLRAEVLSSRVASQQ